MYWLLGRSSALSTYNKLLLYEQILKPIWTYGIQLWGCTSESNKKTIQNFQNKVIRSIANAPWYIRNSNLHKDLGIDSIDEVIKRRARSHQQRLIQHVNIEAQRLLNTNGMIRRLHRTKPLDLA